MSLSDFLVWVGGVGVVAMISWIFEYFGLFQKLEPKMKQIVFFGVCVVVALGAQFIIANASAKIIEQLSPYFVTIAAIFANLFLGSKFHEETKLPNQ